MPLIYTHSLVAGICVSALLSNSAWCGEALHVAQVQQLIAAEAPKMDGGLPVWMKDPTLAGKLSEATYGNGDDVGCAVMNAWVELARNRDTRLAATTKAKPGNEVDALADSMARSVTSVPFGLIKIQSICKDWVREGGAITGNGPASTCFEVTYRIAGPNFTCKHWSQEMKEGGKTSTSWTWEWTASAPLTGAQVAASLAEPGVCVAAVGTMGDHGTAATAWVVALPPGTVKPVAGAGYMLPYQAMAEAIVVALKDGSDILPGADVTRPKDGTVHVSWPQGPASLIIRLDAAGLVIGVTASQKGATRSKDIIELAKESLTAASGEVVIERSPAGERWRRK